MKINILDSSVYNHISAGEVVEKPASIVKELVENSIDAGANQIVVEIKRGGIDYICVSDNGSGIEYGEVEKVFVPHATSKLATVSDLDHICTLGFRGEAMASIASVARVTLETQTRDGQGCIYKINGGVKQSQSPYSRNPGTSVAVENLFFNTPARAKFLRKAKMEENEITQLISRFIFANPNIQIDYIVDDSVVYSHHAGDLFSAICCVYGLDISQNVAKVEYYEGDIKINGYVSRIGFSKPNKTYQTTIINGRYVVDETVSKAVYYALEDYLMTRQYPVFILNITIPIEDIDVNVHPSKLNIKFADPQRVSDIITSAVRQALFTSPKQKIEFNTQPVQPVVLPEIKADAGVSFNPDVEPVETDDVKEISLGDYSPVVFDTKVVMQDTSYMQEQVKMTETVPVQKQDIKILDGDCKIIGEIFETYILVEKENELLIIDFHAGHERLNYDHFCKMMENKQLAVQDMLIPYTQRVNPAEMNYLLSMQQDLHEIGFDIDQFGQNDIRISTMPVLLKDINIKAFVDDLLFDMKLHKSKTPYQIKNYLMQTSCKNAVKSGFILNKQEIDELLSKIDKDHPVLLCPHGRPIIYKLTRSMVDRWFKRIV